jgi:hypothetical protein
LFWNTGVAADETRLCRVLPPPTKAKVLALLMVQVTEPETQLSWLE